MSDEVFRGRQQEAHGSSIFRGLHESSKDDLVWYIVGLLLIIENFMNETNRKLSQEKTQSIVEASDRIKYQIEQLETERN